VKSAALFYLAAALALTWPLALSITHAIPWDMGDPVLNTWILAWSAEHLRRFFSGELTAFSGYWDANIFHPSPLALAYSEHLFAQAFQIWPVYALTRNPVLCYNLVFLSTFVLSGLGAFLLVRDITGSRAAALVAGLMFAFSPYRIPQFSHVQVLSSQWMPFALYALRRHVETGSRSSLWGAGLALLAQNLSCGYYLLFFLPVAAAYVLFQIAQRDRWSDRRLLVRLTIVALVVLAITWPFVRPYLELRELGFPPRPLEEVRRFSADIQGYLVAPGSLWLWGGRWKAFYRPEGELFQGVLPPLLAVYAIALLIATTRPAHLFDQAASWGRRAAALALALFTFTNVVAAFVIVFTGGFIERVGGMTLRLTRPGGAILRSAAGLFILAWLAPGVRRWIARAGRSETTFFAVLLAAALVLSLGPSITNAGKVTVRTAPYLWLYDLVPGFDGLRVPARFAMLVVLALSVLAGVALAHVHRRWKMGASMVALCGGLFVVEAGAAPIGLNVPFPVVGLAPPPPSLYPADGIPEVYRRVTALPESSVLVEFPIGALAWDVRYMFYSTFHWRRLVNGFSGGVPQRYARDVAAMSRFADDPETAWAHLRVAGASHAIVHLNAYRSNEGQRVLEWLHEGSAKEIGRYGADVLLALPEAHP
jgi:hypothetical protein